MHTGPVWCPRAAEGQPQQGQCQKGLDWHPDRLSLQNQTKTKPNQTKASTAGKSRSGFRFSRIRTLIWILTVGDSVWSLWHPPPLCSLASGQCLLNQSTLDFCRIRTCWLFSGMRKREKEKTHCVLNSSKFQTLICSPALLGAECAILASSEF